MQTAVALVLLRAAAATPPPPPPCVDANHTAWSCICGSWSTSKLDCSMTCGPLCGNPCTRFCCMTEKCKNGTEVAEILGGLGHHEKAVAAAAGQQQRRTELWSRQREIDEGVDTAEHTSSPRPHEYVDVAALPNDFSWMNVSNVNYLTKNLNQHIPQCEC